MQTIRSYSLSPGVSSVSAPEGWRPLSLNWSNGSAQIGALINPDVPYRSYTMLLVADEGHIPLGFDWAFIGSVLIPGTDNIVVYAFIA